MFFQQCSDFKLTNKKSVQRHCKKKKENIQSASDSFGEFDNVTTNVFDLIFLIVVSIKRKLKKWFRSLLYKIIVFVKKKKSFKYWTEQVLLNLSNILETPCMIYQFIYVYSIILGYLIKIWQFNMCFQSKLVVFVWNTLYLPFVPIFGVSKYLESDNTSSLGGKQCDSDAPLYGHTVRTRKVKKYLPIGWFH